MNYSGFVEFTMTNNDADFDKVSHNFLKDEVLKLRNAIRLHRDQKGDDRCWMDDIELYKTLPEGVANSDLSLLSDEQFRHNCDLFIKNRKCPVPQGAVIGQYVMDRLRDRIGQAIVVIGVKFCCPEFGIYILRELRDFEGFIVEDIEEKDLMLNFGFIEEKSAVRKILSYEGDVLYNNSIIPSEFGIIHYDQGVDIGSRSPFSRERIQELRIASFGKEVAERLSQTSSK